MGKIFKLPVPASKFGFQRAQRDKKGESKENQFDLFRAQSAKVLEFPSRLSLFEEALRHDERGDADAEELYKTAIEKEDSVADAYCNLGVIASRRDEKTAAFDLFTRALKADPRHAESHYNLGNLYFDMGSLDLAKHHYELAVSLSPEFPNVYFNLGLVLAMRNEFHAAIEMLGRYQELTSSGEAAKASSLLENLQRSILLEKKESS